MQDEILCLSIEKVACVARLQLGYETMPKKGLGGGHLKLEITCVRSFATEDPDQQDTNT